MRLMRSLGLTEVPIGKGEFDLLADRVESDGLDVC